MITYLVWDAGGTLFDTYPAVVAAATAALQDFGHVAPEPAILLDWFRQTLSHGIRSVAAAYVLDADAFEARFSACYESIDAACQSPFPGVVDVCRWMRVQGGSNFIVTHRDRASLRRLLDAHGMTELFTGCITRDEPFPRKPDPASILALMRRYALSPEDGLAIGDRDLDIQAGKNAGLRTCFFGSDRRTVSADLKIVHYNELYCWLRQRMVRGENASGEEA